MRKLLRWARARAKEPSTWVGMAVIAGTLGVVEADTARGLAEGVALVLGGALVGKTGHGGGAAGGADEPGGPR